MNKAESAYRLYAQNKDGDIILENTVNGLYISTSVDEVIRNPKIHELLNEKDLAIIHFIAAENTTAEI